jgi:hypothetical protein
MTSSDVLGLQGLYEAVVYLPTETTLNKTTYRYSNFIPLQNPTSGIPVTEGRNVYRGNGSPTPRCDASCQGLHGTGVVIAVLLTIPSGHQAALHCI